MDAEYISTGPESNQVLFNIPGAVKMVDEVPTVSVDAIQAWVDGLLHSQGHSFGIGNFKALEDTVGTTLYQGSILELAGSL